MPTNFLNYYYYYYPCLYFKLDVPVLASCEEWELGRGLHLGRQSRITGRGREERRRLSLLLWWNSRVDREGRAGKNTADLMNNKLLFQGFIRIRRNEINLAR